MIKSVFLSTINYDHPQRGMLHAMCGIFGASNVGEYDYLELQRQGLSVETINERFVDRVRSFPADWMFLQLQDSAVITADSIRRTKEINPRMVVSHWTGDARPYISPYLASICSACDLTLVSNVGQLESYRAAGACRAEYMQIGVDWHEDVLGEPNWEPPFRVPDVVFIGGYYGSAFPEGSEERLRAIRALQQAGFDIGVVGSGWPSDVPVVGACTVKQQHHVWKRAKVAISVNHFNNIERYYSDRQLIAMASATPVVCRDVPGLDIEFVDGIHCAFFRNENELVRRVKFLLEDRDTALKMGRRGRAKVMRHHSWFSRFLGVLPLIEELQASK